MTNRIVIIVAEDKEKHEMKFHTDVFTDSKALHHALTTYDPGDNYIVTFKNAE